MSNQIHIFKLQSKLKRVAKASVEVDPNERLIKIEDRKRELVFRKSGDNFIYKGDGKLSPVKGEIYPDRVNDLEQAIIELVDESFGE